MIRLPGLSAVAKGRPRLSRVFSGILLALIAFLAVSVRLGGIGDRRAWNPDEALISHWMKRHQAGAGFDAFYPGGFFVMSRPAKIVFENLINRPLWKIALKSGLTDVAYSPRGMAHRQWGLLFNLFLTVLSIGLVYHLGSMIVGSRTGALAGAFAFAFHPVFVEHSHYLETDIAMLFCAVLALWAMTRYRRAPRACTLAFCAFICGFGFGVKYTNAVLLPVLLLLIVAMRFKRNRDMPNLEARAGVLTASDSFLSKGVRWARRSCVPLIVIAIAFFVLGNEVATPRSAPKPERRPAPAVEASDVPPPAAQASDAVSASATRFIKAAKHLRTESQDLIAGEGQRERLVFLARSFAMALAAPGVPWLLFVAAGMVVLVASPTFRLHLPLTLGYPVAYVGMIAVAAPWFRNQEILPLLPSFSLAIAALVSVSAGCLRNGRADASRPLSLFLVQRIGAGFVLLSVCAVFTFAWMRAADLDDIFAKPDTRESAADFLTQAFPVEESIFLDRQMIVNVPGMTNVVKGGAWLGESIESYRAANPGLRWFLVNGSLAGRGMLDPITGRLRPAFREREHAFRRRARLAQSWGLVNAESAQWHALAIPTFRSPVCELWALDPEPGENASADGVLAGLRSCDVLLRAENPVFYQGQGVAAPRSYVALEPNACRQIGFGGPGALTNGVWLVLCNPNPSELDAKIKGYGGRKRVVVQGGATTRIHLKPRFQDRMKKHVHFAWIRLRVRPLVPGSDVRPVRVFAAFGEDDAHRLLIRVREKTESETMDSP